MVRHAVNADCACSVGDTALYCECDSEKAKESGNECARLASGKGAGDA